MGRGMILHLWTVKGGSQEGEEAADGPSPSREEIFLLGGGAAKKSCWNKDLLLGNEQKIIWARERSWSRRYHATSLLGDFWGDVVASRASLAVLMHWTWACSSSCLRHWVSLPCISPGAERGGQRLLSRHKQCVLGNRMWTWDEDQYYFVVDLNFSFSSSKGDFLDAANEDRLTGSLITVS